MTRALILKRRIRKKQMNNIYLYIIGIVMIGFDLIIYKNYISTKRNYLRSMTEISIDSNPHNFKSSVTYYKVNLIISILGTIFIFILAIMGIDINT